MDLLLDTHVLIWSVGDVGRISRTAHIALESPDNQLWVSAATAWEYADLHTRGRIPRSAAFGRVAEQLGCRTCDVPADLWRLAESLPDLHRDPVDRMLVAHAIHAGMTLVTADATLRRYPVETLW